jgi:hypothetical protein
MTSTHNVTISEQTDAEVDLEAVAQAVDSAMEDADNLRAAEVILLAAAAMPVDASNFDRGIAAGVALARFADQADPEADKPF